MTTIGAKSVLFEEEQRAILNKIYEIIGINETKKEFTLYELCSKPDSIKQIVDMKTDIRKFFSASHWACFKDKDYKSNNEYIVLIRNILKSLKIKYTVVSTKIKENNHFINTQLYKIE